MFAFTSISEVTSEMPWILLNRACAVHMHVYHTSDMKIKTKEEAPLEAVSPLLNKDNSLS